jgi:hypothetical protein
MKQLLKLILSVFVGSLLWAGCAVVSQNRVFPKFTWYWSKDAQLERDYKDRHFVIHDIVEDDFWLGQEHKWGEHSSSKLLTEKEANKILLQMRKDEEGGYADDRDNPRPIQVEDFNNPPKPIAYDSWYWSKDGYHAKK